jgi:hypothetical protein
MLSERVWGALTLDESGEVFWNWLRSLFSGDRLKSLRSFLGFADGNEDSDSRSAIKPSISYDDIRNANASIDLKASPVEKARYALKDIQEGTFHYATGFAKQSIALATISTDLEQGPDVVREWLHRARLDVSALDPTKTVEENEAMLRDAPRLGHIARARKLLAAMVSSDQSPGSGDRTEMHNGLFLDDPRDLARSVQAELDKASKIARTNGGAPVELSALDPSKSSEQMQQELHKQIIEGYIINARKEVYVLQNAGSNSTYDDDNKTQQWLDKANEADFGILIWPSSAVCFGPPL